MARRSLTAQNTFEDLLARVQRLEDESAIRRLMADMMKTADERDNPLWAERMVAFYTEDGQWTSASGFAAVGMTERGRAALDKKFKTGTLICESAISWAPSPSKKTPQRP